MYNVVKAVQRQASTASLSLLNGHSERKTLEVSELESAALASNWSLVKSLVKSGNASQHDVLGTTGLLACCAGSAQGDAGNGMVEVVAELANAESVKQVDVFGRTALHILAANRLLTTDATKLVEVLIRNGCDVNARDWGNNTPLHVCAAHGTSQVLETLLAHGADPLLRDNDGELPIHDAAREGHTACLKLLVEAGCSIRSKDTKGADGGFTPLHCASANNHLDAISYILSLDAKIDARDRHGRTALFIAAEQGWYDAFSLLLSHGAKLNAHTKTRSNVLHAITSMLYSLSPGTREYAKLCQLVVDKDPQLCQEVNLDGNTPLHTLCSANLPSASLASDFANSVSQMHTMLQTLSDKCPRTKNKNGETELYRACTSAPLSFIQLLHTTTSPSATASTLERTLAGRNILHAAARYGREDVINWIKTALPEYDILKLQVDKKGSTPQSLARLHPATAGLLE